MQNKLLTIAITSVLACGGAAAPAPSAQPATVTSAPTPLDQVDGPTARSLVKGGAILVDVRSPDEFAEKHIEGAINVPADTVTSHDFGGKDKDIVLYCLSGHRSKRAADALRAAGYTKVHLLGAMSAWGE